MPRVESSLRAANDNRPIDTPEIILVGLFTGALDAAKLLIAFIPGVDLIGWLIWFSGFGCVNLYFLMRLGPSRYFGGKRAGQKFATTAATATIGIIPVLDDFVPELTIEALGVIASVNAEAREIAAARAKALKDAQAAEAAQMAALMASAANDRAAEMRRAA